jgi:hypothetical protein
MTHWLTTTGLILLLFAHLWVGAQMAYASFASPYAKYRTAHEFCAVAVYAAVQFIGCTVLAAPIVWLHFWTAYLNVKHQLEQEAGRDEAL